MVSLISLCTYQWCSVTFIQILALFQKKLILLVLSHFLLFVVVVHSVRCLFVWRPKNVRVCLIPNKTGECIKTIISMFMFCNYRNLAEKRLYLIHFLFISTNFFIQVLFRPWRMHATLTLQNSLIVILN